MEVYRKLMTQSKRKTSQPRGKPQQMRTVRSDSHFFPIHFCIHASNRVHRHSISSRSSSR